MKIFSLFIVFLLSTTLFFLNNVVAQQPLSVSITGKVIDKQNVAIHGVSITEVDADKRVVRGVMTDVEGNFIIRITNTKNKLSFSIIGYKEIVEMTIGARKVFNVTMETSSNDMGEVIVTSTKKSDNGFLSISDRNLTTAVSRINAKEMEEMQAASIDQALQGRIAGVDIAANSGDPGAGMQIRIRGTSSINSSTNPLIVVDGMPYETSIPSDFNFGTADEQGYAQLLNISPSDIKDISILKDAAATALWGSRAANGVLLINTKRGTKSLPSISYTFKGSYSFKARNIPMLNGDQYSNLIPEEYMNRNGIPLNLQNVNEFKLDPNDPYWYNNYNKNTNWIDAISRTGNTQDHNVSITGGGEKARYYASLGYLNQKGITIGTDLSRISTRINLDYIVSDRIKIRSDLSFSHTENNKNYDDNIRNVAYRKMPNMSIYEYDEYGNLTPNYFSPVQNVQGQYSTSSSSTYNPVAMANTAKNLVVTERVTPKFNIQYSIIPRILTASADVQFDISNTKNNKFLPQIATGRPWTEPAVNQAYDGDNDGFTVTTKTTLTYTPRIKNPKHSFVGLINMMTNDGRSLTQQAQTSNTATSYLQDPSIPSRANGTTSALGASTSQTRTMGGLINAQYGYNDIYMINVGLRGDATSRLSSANRYGLFPTISTRWRISSEKFMERFSKKINDLSLRLSYGQSGNAPSKDYSFYSTYGSVAWDYLNQGTIVPSNLALQNLKWETVVGTNIGFNLVMFKNRLNVDVDIYKNRTKDLLFNGLQISGINGFSSVNMNVGTMDNQGFEVSMNTTPIKTKDWIVDININVARNLNVIREISEFYPLEKGDITVNGKYKTYLQINNPFGSFYGYKSEGVYKDLESTIATDAKGEKIMTPLGKPVYMRFNYPNTDYTFQPGDAKYQDVNHDGTIDSRDVVYLGNSNPLFTGGFGFNISYKARLKLSTFFNFRYKYAVINQTEMTTTNMYGYDNQSTAVQRRWKKSGDVTDIPRALYATGYNWLGSDRYVEDGSFLRFRTVTLRYTFAKKIIDRFKIKGLSCYVTGENLFTWTNYRGQDPEVSVRGSDPFRVATDISMTPPVKMLTFGLVGNF